MLPLLLKPALLILNINIIRLLIFLQKVRAINQRREHGALPAASVADSEDDVLPLRLLKLRQRSLQHFRNIRNLLLQLLNILFIEHDVDMPLNIFLN